MAIARRVQTTGRSLSTVQSWLVRLLLLTIAIYGSLVISFWSRHRDFASLQRSLQGQENGVEAQAIELIRINAGDYTASSSTKKSSTASTTHWKNVAADFLSTKESEAAGGQIHTSTIRSSSTAVTLEEPKKSPSSGETQNRTSRSQSDTRSSAMPQETAPLASGAAELQLRAKAEAHALSVKFLPSGDMRKRALKCVGWRSTGNCNADGPREPGRDLGCADIVPNSASGYCEVEDAKSGERFRVMSRPCNIFRNRVPFRCINAPAFTRFRVQAHTVIQEPLSAGYKLPNVDYTQPPHDGIVMVVYPKLVPSAFATIRALREILGCSLPIEICYRPDEMENVQDALVPLQRLARNSSVGQISFREITDPVAKRFVAKVYAIRHSFFDRVLFLDADNVPVRDPRFLFDSREFKETGAIFWPDFWHPSSTMFGLHSKSLLWELLGMPFVDMFEQESGQLVVDRRRHAAPLELVFFYATHDPNFLVHYKLAWGDKDLFRLAWLKLNATFHMIETPPAMAGMVSNMSAFCGMTMVQHDADGEVLFLHRNKHKLTGLFAGVSATNTYEVESNDGTEDEELRAHSSLSDVDQLLVHSNVDEYPDPAIWTHLMSFDSNWTRDHYVVQAFMTSLNFTSNQKCFGRRSLHHSPQFHVQAIGDLSFAGFETDLRHFAKEAGEILRS